MASSPETVKVLDRRARPLQDLRISVTDRCNFRCSYCMPKEVFGPGFKFLPHDRVLSFEEITRVASAFVALGVTKLRLTGGEPLLRRELPKLIRMLADASDADLALTTNGSLLAAQAADLARAGLKRVTVSLDALDDALFRRLNDVNISVQQVLDGISAASDVGLTVKINAVIRRGLNEGEVTKLAEHFRQTGHIVRFIEFMDVGSSNSWRESEVFTAKEIVATLKQRFPLQPLEANYSGEVARRWGYTDGGGEVGIISSISEPFCGNCTRTRLSADGKLYTCLFATQGTDILTPLRAGATNDELVEFVRTLWARREDRYSELRAARPIQLRKIEMSYIGG